MITREAIRELAEFESAEGGAVTFYYQPWTPENKSHRGEAILVKDLVREAVRESERHGRNGHTRADLQRIAEVAERLHGNHARAKAIFACAGKNVWREYDLPPRLQASKLQINRRFHLKPLAAVLAAGGETCVCLVDRTRARLFSVANDEIQERLGFFNDLPRHGKSEGWAGYDAKHVERHIANDAMQHFKIVADALRDEVQRGSERVLIGCRDENWHEIEPHLHSYVRQRLIGRFRIDPATADLEQVRQEAQRIIAEEAANRRAGLVREVLGEAHRNGRGALGLRHVLRSIENGEAQALLIGRDFQASAAECPNCGHLDYRLVENCAACGSATRELEDVADALVGIALRNGIELEYVSDDDEFAKAGNIGALLRFRADQNTPQKLAS